MAQQVFTNRYEIVHHLARGGMAEVYLARDLLLDRSVALKVLFPELSADPSFVERFRREAQAAANLNHPNIVSVYDWGEDTSTYFIVMEYVDGPTLRDLLRSEGRLHPDRAAEIATEIAAALTFAHRNGVIHRDVKPGNVLLTPTGQVKVTDFGIARAARDSGREHLTQTGTVMGTATYFSPEQAQGLPLDARTDIYALGVVLYELVTGRPPFVGDNPVAIAYQHVRETPTPPGHLNPDVPPALEAIILKALAKNPARRYPSASELRADLLRYRQGRPVAAQDLGVGTQPVATLITSQPAFHDVSPPLTPSTDEAAATLHPKRRTRRYLALLLGLAVLAGLAFLAYRVLAAPRTVRLQDVTSRPVDVAQSILVTQGLRVTRLDEPNDQVTAGVVFDQSPKPGVVVDKGSEVRLRVSAGPPPVVVPDVGGTDVNDARAKLEGAGLKVVTNSRPDDSAPAGQVVAQTPAPGTSLKRGDSVTLSVSSGKPKVPVPKVAGEDPTTAANELGQAGFKVRQQVEPSTSVASGRVTRTDPPGGASAAKGATVTLFVSSGAPEIPVPSVIGLTEADATSQLKSAGFNAAVQNITDASRCGATDVGRVVQQSPTAGTKAPPQSQVTLTICRAAATVPPIEIP